MKIGTRSVKIKNLYNCTFTGFQVIILFIFMLFLYIFKCVIHPCCIRHIAQHLCFSLCAQQMKLKTDKLGGNSAQLTPKEFRQGLTKKKPHFAIGTKT